MIHDIAHCQGNGCPIRETCFRYQAHLEVQEGKADGTLFTYFKPDYLCDRAKENL